MKVKLFLAGTSLLLLIASIFAWRVWAAPREVEKEVTLLTYELEPSWEHQGYGLAPATEGKNPSFSTRLIQGVEVSYSYKFAPEKPARRVQIDVEVRGVMESPGAWQREFILAQRSSPEREVTLTFPLDMATILKAGSYIAQELGTGAPASEVTLKALVHITADTEGGRISDDFVHSVKVKSKGATLEWDRELGLFQTGYQRGTRFEHQGAFGYIMSLKPSILDAPVGPLQALLPEKPEEPAKKEVEPNPVFFTKLIESINISYNYLFLPQAAVTEVSGWVEVRGVVESPGLWQREVVLVPRAEHRGQYTATFPLDTAPLFALAAEIDKELGTKTTSPKVSLKAVAHTVAGRGGQELVEDFIQPLGLRMGETTIEIDRGELFLSRSGEWQGLNYKHQGEFSYRVQLKPSLLFGPEPVTISSPPPPQEEVKPPPPPPIIVKSETPQKGELKKVGTGLSLERKGLEKIEMTLNYELAGSKPLERVEQKVEVKAVLGKEGSWEESFTLAQESYKSEKFSHTFPLDLPVLYAAIADQEKKSGASTAIYDLNITATVTTQGEIAGSALSESFERKFVVKLLKDKVELPELTSEPKKGAVTKKEIVTRSLAGSDRLGSLGGVGMTLVAFLYAFSTYWENRKKRLTPWEIEAQNARKKYKDILVEVEELPQGAGQTVVRLGSLREMVKAAEALLKPVLLRQEAEGYSYWIIDGQTRFEYVSSKGSNPAP